MKIPHNAFVAGTALVTAVSFGIAFGLALDSMPIGIALGCCFFPVFSMSSGEDPAKAKGKLPPDADLRD